MKVKKIEKKKKRKGENATILVQSLLRLFSDWINVVWVGIDGFYSGNCQNRLI